jgi:hypothetical protein
MKAYTERALSLKFQTFKRFERFEPFDRGAKDATDEE